MNLPNSLFEDFPIEFKEINPQDFPLFEVENNRQKIIIEPNDEGYINDVFQEKINLRDKNSVVVNAAVGQGKSTAIIKTVGRYYHEHPDTLIIVASPFVSLVEQYCNDIHLEANIPEEQIFNYGNLSEEEIMDYKSMRVHVVTVNTLLGNPGEDGFKNSDIKRFYFNSLIEQCRRNNVKAIFIYDEIHDAIQNFRQEFIFSLWKWKDIILKNYILSATYNEASKVVIKYLAELTDKKIQIIESKRVIKRPERLSKLYLHYSPANNFTIETPELVNLIKKLVKTSKKIDILSYSKALAKDILKDDKGIGKLLKDKFGELNDCTAQGEVRKRDERRRTAKKYDENKCNVGTNFKTGVSIKKTNHAYIVILPPRATQMAYSNKYGIFSGGVISIIQALARQRKKGEIHIILPMPEEFDYDSLQYAGFTDEQVREFSINYDKIYYHSNSEDVEEVKYFPLHTQDYFTLKFYKEKLHYNVHEEIDYIKSIETQREGLPSLSFHDYETFKLRRGEEYLANSYHFFGKDLAAYVTYCAFTNQFVNCKLVGMTYKTALFFEEGKIYKKLESVFNTYFGEGYYDGFMSFLNFPYAYNSFRDEIFGNYIIKLKKANSGDWITIKPYGNKEFETQLLKFLAAKYYGNSYCRANDLREGDNDIPYTRDMYFIECLSVVNSIEGENNSENNRGIVRFYQIINHFRNKMIAGIQQYTSSNLNYTYLKTTRPVNFYDSEDTILFEELVSLISQDSLLNNEIFEFKKGLTLKTLYSKLLHDFFVSEESRLPVGIKRPHIRKILEVKSIPESPNLVDLITEPEHFFYEPTEEDTSLMEVYGGYENYLREQEMVNRKLNDYMN